MLPVLRDPSERRNGAVSLRVQSLLVAVDTGAVVARAVRTLTCVCAGWGWLIWCVFPVRAVAQGCLLIALSRVAREHLCDVLSPPSERMRVQ